MGSTISIVKTLIVPAVISLILFLVSTYVAIPLWRKWRNRYSQYLPIDTISTSTVSLRHRIQHGIARMMVPSTWRRNAHERLVVATDASDDGEDGEELGEVGEETRRAMSEDARRGGQDSTRRLSRDLEEGFRDDSDDSDDGGNERNGSVFCGSHQSYYALLPRYAGRIRAWLTTRQNVQLNAVRHARLFAAQNPLLGSCMRRSTHWTGELVGLRHLAPSAELTDLSKSSQVKTSWPPRTDHVPPPH